MSATLEEPLLDDPPAPAPAGDPDGEWRLHKSSGREFVPRQGRGGIIYREGTESIAEARARDAKGPKDKRPKPKPKAKLPPQPSASSLQELEHELSEALSAPAALAAANGDQFMADHFAREGPRLARNLVVSAKYNPWLKARLEAAMTGGDDMLIRLVMSMGLAGALVSYAVVPIVYYLDPPFLARARDMYRVPKRNIKDDVEPEGALRAVSPETAAAPAAGPVAA